MHAADRRDEALRLVAAGLNDCEVSRRLGIPRTTVRDWRRPPYVARAPRARARCPRCGRPGAPAPPAHADYAELLGLYLGDGHITTMARAQRLRISLDAAHPRVVGESAELLRRLFPGNVVGRVLVHEGRMVVLRVYSQHLSCLFPQHGPGKKHERLIALEPWQQSIVDAEPWRFLRGCIRSDGCVFVNRTGRYEYLSYDFTNLSPGILDVFMATCDAVGLHPRRYSRRVRLYRRDDVRALLEHVGVKG